MQEGLAKFPICGNMWVIARWIVYKLDEIITEDVHKC